MTKTNNNTPANVNVNNVLNLNTADGQAYTAAENTPAADVAAANLTAAVAAAEYVKKTFVGVTAEMREARAAVVAATIDNAAARYADGTATAADVLTLANHIAAEHAAAAVVSTFSDLTECMNAAKEARRAFVADVQSLGAACRMVRDHWETAAPLLTALGVNVEKKSVTPALFRTHELNPFAVAVCTAGTLAALPTKAGELKPVTAWNAERVVAVLAWNTICAEQMTAEQCERRRALLEQVTAAHKAAKEATAAERAAKAAAEKAAKELAEAAEHAAVNPAVADELEAKKAAVKRTRRDAAAASKEGKEARRAARNTRKGATNTADAVAVAEAKQRTRRARKTA